MSSIVWLASYPKSGNTWVRAFIHNYLEDSHEPADINSLDKYFADDSKPYWYERHTDRPLSELSIKEICELRCRVHRDIAASRQGSVIVKTHGYLGEYEGIPLHEMAVTAGAIYVVRNPLDVVLSLADHFGISIDEAIAFMNDPATGSPTDEANVGSVLGSWSGHVESWTGTEGANLHLVRYEDLVDRPAKAFAGIVSFLNLGKNSAGIKKAVRFSSFQTLRNLEAKRGFVEKSPNSKRFFRSGRKNQWPSTLSRDQVAALVDAHREQMSRFRYVPPGY
jgi:hypothetical protein